MKAMVNHTYAHTHAHTRTQIHMRERVYFWVCATYIYYNEIQAQRQGPAGAGYHQQ